MTGSFDDILQERYQLGSLYSELDTNLAVYIQS